MKKNKASRTQKIIDGELNAISNPVSQRHKAIRKSLEDLKLHSADLDKRFAVRAKAKIDSDKKNALGQRQSAAARLKEAQDSYNKIKGLNDKQLSAISEDLLKAAEDWVERSNDAKNK